MGFFKILYEDKNSQARLGEIETKHGIIKTPIFMPVGTVASVKAVEQRNLIADVNAEIILSNTYHLYLRPGINILSKCKGLHNFMSWKKPILTDRIGADIIMPLDECTPFSCEREYTKKSIARTHRWLERCIAHFKNTRDESNDYQHLFGIVQGSLDKDLRRESSEFIANSDVSGFAIGGVCHTEGNTQGLYDISEYVCSLLPKDKPRYFMGVGTPLDIVRCIALGVDMFDCSMPTHCGRNGRIFTTEGVLQIRNKKWEDCFDPLDANINNYISQTYTKSYVHHLFKSKELLGYQIASIQNLAFYMWVIEKTRENIKNNSLQEWIREIENIMI